MRSDVTRRKIFKWTAICAFVAFYLAAACYYEQSRRESILSLQQQADVLVMRLYSEGWSPEVNREILKLQLRARAAQFSEKEIYSRQLIADRLSSRSR